MEIKQIKKVLWILFACYMMIAVGVYFIAGEQFQFWDGKSEGLTPAAPIGEITKEMPVRQRVVATADLIRGVSLRLSTYARTNTSHLTIHMEDEMGNVLAEKTLETQGIQDNQLCDIYFDVPVETTPGQALYLVLSSQDGSVGNAVTAWWGNAVSTSRGEIVQDIAPEDLAYFGQTPVAGKLSVSLYERELLWLGQVYWYAVAGTGVLLAGCSLYVVRCAQQKKSIWILRIFSAFNRYGFLLRQLVNRDFKTKYKRSILGVLWSLLNPLLTMSVQYVVFSTLFKSDIPNFALYLLTGIVCFNFFNEAANVSLMSIVGNSTLITKVYVPKYIYPLSRVLSSSINLILSMIPLLAVMIITRTPIRPAVLLLPFGLICLLVFSLAVSFILSTCMVFFRDTQFLWGVISMLWMYATPIFYPESIISEQFLLLYKCNPLYHIIRFIRCILIDGISPAPKAYLFCFLASFVPLLFGALVFKKNQDKFVLHL